MSTRAPAEAGAPADSPARRRGFAGRWLRRAGWALLALLLLWGLLWLAVPPLAKSQAEQRLGELLGRPVRIGSIEFKPWTLELTVRQVEVGPAAGAAAGALPLLRVARLYVDADARSLWNRAPVLNALEVESPDVHLTRTAEGHYDIDDLLARFAPQPDAPPAGEPPRFAVYNVAVRGAAVHFDDRPVQRRHELTALELTLPFISNLPAQLEVKVQPRVAFRFNGTAFDTGAQATPFAATRSASLQFKMAPLDLRPYVAYLPEGLPLRLLHGTLEADLGLDFKQPRDAAPQVQLRGNVALRQVALAVGQDATRTPWLEWQGVTLDLRDVQPLRRRLAFGTLKIDAPQLHLARNARGELNLPVFAAASAPAGARASAASAARPSVRPSAPAAPAAPSSATAEPPWAVSLQALQLAGMRVHWADAAVQPAAALELDELSLSSGPLAWPLAGAVPVTLAARLNPAAAEGSASAPAAAAAAAASASLGHVTVDAQFDPATRRAQADLKLDAFALQALGPYLAPHFAPRVEGRLTVGGHAELALADGAPQLTVRDGSVQLDDLRVLEAAATPSRNRTAGLVPRKPASPSLPAAGVKQLLITGVGLDLNAQRLSIAQIKLQQPVASVLRDSEGQWNVQRWLAPAEPAAQGSAPRRAGQAHATAPATPAATAATAPRRAPTPPAAPWRIELRDALLDGGQLRLSDAYASGAAAAPGDVVAFDVKALRVALQNLALSTGPQGVRAGAAVPLRISARLTAPASERDAAAAAALDWRGQVAPQPLLARGSLRLERFPVHLFEPYFGQHLKVNLERAEVGTKADISVQGSPAGWRVKAAGDVLLADVKVNAREADGNSGDPLLTWQSFTLKGVNVALEPGRPPSVAVAEAALNDFYSRLVITEQGRFNLQDVAAADAAASAPAPAAAASGAGSMPVAVAASSPAPEVASSSAASAASSANATSAAPAAPGADIKIGATTLTNGRVDFTDRFVRPNYSAALTELNGRLGAFRSGTRDMATLELRGRAAGTALLDISGQLNPTADPLALDIRAKATDLELAPLSPYAGKYAGYAIERGKLSMDVAYKIDADGKLDAKNQVILNQLTFGDKIDSPTATKLPVLFAVALLKDRNGVIDINLPVSGSVKDPQFSVGGIIWKVILNLIGRALTAPFSLFAGGGGDDLSNVEFAPGTARMAAAGDAALDKVAKALADRPALKMTVTGAADPVSEREAFQQAALDARLLAERRKELSRGGATAEVVNATGSLGAEDRARVLKEVYRQTSFPDKPKNFIGIAKDLPAAEMERLLKARTLASVDALRELALQRGLAVRDALIARGLPSERLFLAAPKLRASGEDDAAWKPQVQLTLSAN